jgi:NAD(P)-dependent dehydrogenase (short-subunit alcohol dehydrogenase family)
MAPSPLEHLREVFEVNVFGVHRVTNALVDLIRGSRGRIVTLSSISGVLAGPHMGAYAMSKHALEAYTDSLAKHLAPDGVRVAAIAPGNFASSIAEKSVAHFAPPPDAPPEIAALLDPDADLSLSWLPTPEPVAHACYAALFDDAPRERYLVVPTQDEADRTLAQAALEWVRLNASTSFAWTTERLLEEIEGLDGDTSDPAEPR